MTDDQLLFHALNLSGCKLNLIGTRFIIVWADGIDGGGWTLVRHVPPGNKWYTAADHLTGSAVYGTPAGETSEKEFSVRFDNITFNQFLFATGRKCLRVEDLVYLKSLQNTLRHIALTLKHSLMPLFLNIDGFIHSGHSKVCHSPRGGLSKKMTK